MPESKPLAHVETFLTSLGLPAEDAAAIISMPEDKVASFDGKPFAEKVKANYTTQLQNDPAFFSDLTLEKLPAEVKKKVESAQYGRAANIVRQKFLKSLGMTEADYADLPEDQQKDIEAFIPAMAEKFAKSKAGDKQLQQELIEARKKIESFDGLEEKLKTKFEGETNQKISSIIFNANLISELSAIEGLKIPASDLAKTASDALLSEYGFEKVGDFGIELRQKANSQMKVLKNGSSQELTLKDALIDLATKRNWIEKETKVDPKTGSGKVKVEVDPSNEGLKTVVAPHLQEKISKKIAAEQ